MLKRIFNTINETIFKRIHYQITPDGDNYSYWKKISYREYRLFIENDEKEVKKINTSFYVKTSLDDLYDECNNRALNIKARSIAVSASIACAALVCFYYFFSIYISLLLCGILFTILVFFLGQYFEINNYLIFLNYPIDIERNGFYEKLNNQLKELMESEYIWSVDSIIENVHHRYFCAVKEIYKRSSVFCIKKQPGYIQTNLPVPCLTAGDKEIFFFPEFFIIKTEIDYTFESYDALFMKYIEKPFCEFEYPVYNSRVLNFSWFHQKKDGTGDKRFKNNFKAPEVLYSEIIFSSKRNIYLHFQISDNIKAYRFSSFMKSYLSFYVEEKFKEEMVKDKRKNKRAYSEAEQNKTAYNYDFRNWHRREPSQQEKEYKKQRASQEKKKNAEQENHINSNEIKNIWAYKILGIPLGTNNVDIKKAYIDLVKRYHPDKHAHVNEKSYVMAEERLKLINKAFDALVE